MSPHAPPVAAVLADLAAREVELAVEGDRLRYRPQAAVTGLLADRLREHRDELIRIVRTGQARPGAPYSTAELAVLAGAGLTPADVPLLGAAKAAFADLGGLTLVGFEPKPATVTPDDFPADWREMYEERAAIMEFDGALPRDRAEALALADIAALMGGRERARPAAVAAPAGGAPWRA